MNKHKQLLKRILDRHYNKEVVYYEGDDTWYCRTTARYVNTSVIEDYVEEVLVYYEEEEHR
ncbi:hypothetical protein [Bacillus thuringiensis]|uniref:hypothetical protein n=1 Tax=Bacillus thuringiensis TaxID=1428 RepID=UPI000A3CE98F|nr:hypothetical protein [Bacillus thuringiensis]OTZ58476.1 hypothetical protein BK762_00450 [Bacillus thuringiensis serovar toumanoffi]